MTNQSTEYQIFVTATVSESISKRYGYLKKSLQKKFDIIKVNPYGPTVSEPLKHNLVGLRSALIKKNYKILLAICEECRRLGKQKSNNCMDCEEKPNNTIIIFAIDKHDDLYKIAKKFRKKKVMPS